jgi:ABC-type transport system involved in multi-copper enzyme maturation permease subunit
MSALLRAELIKLVTIRGTFGLLIGAVAVALIGAVSTIGSGEREGLAGPLADQQFFLLASVNLALFALILGIKMFTDEVRHGSIVPTMLLAPSRGRVLLAKAIVGALAGAIMVLVAQGVTLALAYVLIGARGVDPGWTAGDANAAIGLVTAGALWAVIGVGVGAVVRHQVAAIVGGVVWIVIVENIGTAFLGD